jgi:hypothetical protein
MRARVPITMPAIAPGLSFEVFLLVVCGVDAVGESEDIAGVDEDDGADEVARVEDREDGEDDDTALSEVGLEAGAVDDNDAAEDTAPLPKICARRTSPTPEPQHAVLSPQHQRSLSARPLHDVIRVFPVRSRVCSQMLRQLPPAQLLSVQKFAK